MTEVAAAALGPEDLAVVIPTAGRWDVLDRTLAALERQRAAGFEVVVVADGVTPPATPEGARVVEVAHGGPGAARNAGVAGTERPLVLFLGDDMVPDEGLVAAHLAVHRARPEPEVAVLGKAEWHPEVAGGRVERWMDRSRSQFDFPDGPSDDAGFGRFVSCNVSFKRAFFVAAGGFDESFAYYYEDLDLGWRLAQRGMRLHYEPAALARHLHGYDLASLERRFRGVATGERHMAELHPWFEPFFLRRVEAARRGRRRGPWWAAAGGLLGSRPGPLGERVRAGESAWYHQRLAPAFLAAWHGAGDLAELRAYLGDRFDQRLLEAHERLVEEERLAAADEQTFYRTSRRYLYDLTVFAMSGTKAPYLAEVRAAVPGRGRLLDFGCGIGADGLRLMADGYEVAFADFDNPSVEFLRWRLAGREAKAEVYDVESDEIPGDFDLVYCFDVIEHVEDPFAFLARLEGLGRLVAVNFLEEDHEDTSLHRPLPVRRLLDHAARRGLRRYRRYHGRSHLVVYEAPRRTGGASRRRSGLRAARSWAERAVGAGAPGRGPRFPPAQWR
jgi:hypothetical protein